MKIPKLFKKAAAFVMAAVTALSIMPATAFAAGDIGTISFSHTYDSNGNAMRYNSSANIGGYTAGGTGNYKYRMFVDGENAFCIQPGVPLKTGNTLKKASSDTWNALSANQKKVVGLALLYGYQGNRNNLSGSDDEKWLATQTLVWEFVTGCREATGSYNQTSTTVYSLHFGSNYANSGARAVYVQIVAMLREHNTIPSFMSGGKNDITKELAYKDGKYSITLTDSNGVLSDYSFSSSDSNVSVSKSGNKLTISSTVAISGSVRITAKRNNVPTVSSSAKLIAYGDPNLQDLVTGVENADTVSAYINIETPTGTIALKKTSEDGVVEGISFTIKGDNFNKTVKTGIVTLDGTVRANKGEVVDTVTTGKDGTAKSKELYLGKYEVKEITAPYGMVLNEEVRSVELVYAGQNVDVTETATSFYNEKQRVEIDLIKSLAIDEAYGIGKNGEIFDVTFGLYAAEELTAADGKTIPADGLIEVISLDESGHGKAISDLPMGSYYVQETSTNSAYIVSDAKYPVIFEYAGQDTETVRIIANEGEAITNDIIYGSVSGKKSDEDGKALGSAVIGIFKTGTTEFTKENAIVATTSKDDGSFSFAKVPYGTWIIREIESPKGYVLSEEEIAVTIGKVDEVVEIELVNYFIKGNIALTKVDEDYPDNKLSGAVFEVYSDTNGDGKLDKDDTLLGEMKELDGGVYQMSELRFGKYLVKETKAPTGFVLDENVYSVSVEENGKTYTVENKAGVGFINAAQKGSLKIVKTSSDGKVEGFSFRVTGVDYDQTFKTDKNGEIVIEGLRIGDYTVSEVSNKASAGYILPADKQATVKVDATAIVQMHNEFRDTPKTGDDFNLGLWVSLAALSVVGAGVLGFVGYKNRKKKKED